MLGRAEAPRPEPTIESRPRKGGRRLAAAALALALLATSAWPAAASAGDSHTARDGDPAAVAVNHVLAEVGEWLLDLAGLGDRDTPPDGGGDEVLSAHAPMGPLIDPDGYVPKDPKPGGKPHDR